MIIHSPNFESAVVKLINKEKLSAEESEAIAHLLIEEVFKSFDLDLFSFIHHF